MIEKVKIFLYFLLCWSAVQAIFFVGLSIGDFKSSVHTIKEFGVFIGSLLLGVIAIPISKLSEAWFYIILTILYFLLGGGVVVFTVLTIAGLIISHIPAILGLIATFKTKSK